MRTYNVGILGFGFIGKVHAFAHANLFQKLMEAVRRSAASRQWERP